MGKITDAIVDDQASCKIGDASPDEQIAWLKEELDRERKLCKRFSNENELLSNMYADAIFRLRVAEEHRDDVTNRLYKIQNNIFTVSKILFEDGKVRMSKEIKKLLQNLLRF